MVWPRNTLPAGRRVLKLYVGLVKFGIWVGVAEGVEVELAEGVSVAVLLGVSVEVKVGEAASIAFGKQQKNNRPILRIKYPRCFSIFSGAAF